MKDGQVQDPEIVIALPTADLSVTATSGATFEVYTGITIRYDQQYSFLLDGVVDQSTSALVLTEVQTVWANIMSKIIIRQMHSLSSMIIQDYTCWNM